MDTAARTRESRSSLPEIDLYRIGGMAGMISGVIAVVANALHPRLSPSDLGDTEKVLDMVAGYSLWRIDHLAIIVALLVGLVAFVAISRSITDFPAASWSRIALVSAIATGAIAAVSFAIDGFVLGGVADEWATASGGAREVILERMITLEHLDAALFAMNIIGLFGATQLLFGIALTQSSDFPSWIGITALVAGFTGVVSGVWMWMVGEANIGNFLVLFSITSVLFALWLLAASAVLLRRSRGALSVSAPV
jgi:hypothetical protein